MTSDKIEILKTIPIDRCCSYAFLNSLFSSLKVEHRGGHLKLEIPKPLQEKLKEIINNFYSQLKVKSDEDNFIISGLNVEQILLDAGLSDRSEFDELQINGINENLLASECCKISFLKGIYLTCGNFYYNKNNNEKSNGYSVEFVFKNYMLADDCKALMKYMGLKVGSSKRGNNVVLYIKDSEMIYNFFVKLEAVETAIEIQNNLLIREMRNDANRQGNCFDANLNKTLTASREQVKAIDYIIKNYGVDYLDESLQETALLRLANPDITLNEMQSLYSQPISRAGLKYKLDKIIAIYKKLNQVQS